MRKPVQTPSLFRLALLARAITTPLLAGGSLLATPLAVAEGTQRYAIAAGPLSETLATFAARAGVNLPLDPAMLGDLRSPGLQGDWNIAQGFEQLLRGTSLEAVPQAGNTYILRPRPASSALQLDATTISGLHDVQPVSYTHLTLPTTPYV